MRSQIRQNKLILTVLLLCAICIPLSGSMAFAEGGSPVINEIYTRHSNGQGNEWVEIYNPGSSDVDISGWQIFTLVRGKMKPASRSFSGTLKAGAYDWIRINGKLMADDKGTVLLLDAEGTEIDSVRYGEGHVPAPEQKKDSLGRVINGQDTDNDLLDFAPMRPTRGKPNPQTTPPPPPPPLPPSNTPPEITENQIFSVQEGSPSGTDIGTILAHDADTDPLSFTILTGNESGDLALDADTGLLSVATPPDYETISTYTLLVELTDGTDTTTGEVRVAVVNIGALVSGQVFHDLDMDGLPGASEDGISSVSILLMNEDTGSTASAITDLQGRYALEVETPGIYLLSQIDLPPVFPEYQWISTSAIPGPGASALDLHTLRFDSGITTTAVINREPYDGNLFGDTRMNFILEIRGQVWNDADADGNVDPAEPGLQGAIIELDNGTTTPVFVDGSFVLYAPLDQAIAMHVVYPVVSLPDFQPTNAIPGGNAAKSDNTTLLIDAPGVAPVWNALTETWIYVSEGHYFGAAFNSTTAITVGTVFNDDNFNGLFDPTELGIPGVTVRLELSTYGPDGFGGKVLLSTEFLTAQTDASGAYEIPFAMEANKLYEGRITSDGPGGIYYALTPQNLDLTYLADGVYPNNNFGYREFKADILTTVFDDLDGDGVMDIGEPGIQGVSVLIELEDDDSNPAGSFTLESDANGKIEFAVDIVTIAKVTLTSSGPGAPFSATTPEIIVIEPQMDQTHTVEIGYAD